MITKDQALTCTNFIQIYRPPASFREGLLALGDRIKGSDGTLQNVIKLDKPVNWRANGKCKTWKRSPDRFQLPIKHGLYSYGYITEENAHLFEVVS